MLKQLGINEKSIKCHGVVIREKRKNLAKAFELLTRFADDFFADGRKG